MKKVDGATAVQNFMADLNKRAERLYEVRREIERRDAEYKATNEALWGEENELKAKLITDLSAINLKSIKVASGDSFAIVKKTMFGFDPTNPKIKEWGIANNIMTIDKDLAKIKFNNIVKANGQLPEGVEKVERESITVRKAATAKVENNNTEESN